MICPKCGNPTSTVKDSREWSDPDSGQTGTGRRRECDSCHTRYTTIEIIVTLTNGVKANQTNGQRVTQTRQRLKPKVNGAAKTEKKPGLKKMLDQALRRARIRAIQIEDEDME